MWHGEKGSLNAWLNDCLKLCHLMPLIIDVQPFLFQKEHPVRTTTPRSISKERLPLRQYSTHLDHSFIPHLDWDDTWIVINRFALYYYTRVCFPGQYLPFRTGCYVYGSDLATCSFCSRLTLAPSLFIIKPCHVTLVSLTSNSKSSIEMADYIFLLIDAFYRLRVSWC